MRVTKTPDHSTAAESLRAWVLHPARRLATSRDPERALEEACSLTEALDALELAGGEVVPLPKPKAGLLFGDGKVAELKAKFADLGIGMVIVDATVSPVQQRNLEKEWQVKLLDRTGLILEIFGARARTREGALQVELAHLTYQRSRLVRSWTHLERQRGGTGFMGGPGETQIEADRRALDEQVTRLKKLLEKSVRTRELHRAARRKIPYPIVALVGYTNAGKSSLFNRLTGADVLAKDMLFATLDPTMRAVTLATGQQVILSDTVGFISDLPTQLVAAFRATLEEVLEADLIIHVRDISHPQTEEQKASVLSVLGDLKLPDAALRSMVEFRNKVDLLGAEAQEAVRAQGGRGERVVTGSAVTGEGLDRLAQLIGGEVAEPERRDTVRVGFGQGAAIAWLHKRKLVQHQDPDAEGIVLQVVWPERVRAQFLKDFGADRVTVLPGGTNI